MTDDAAGGTAQAGPNPPASSRARVMVLGSADVPRELVIALQRLGAEVIAVGGRADAPLHGVADRSVVLDLADADELSATIGRLQPEFLVTAADTAQVVATDALISAAETGSTYLVPSIRGARLTADREGMRRLAADDLGVPTVPFWFTASVDELRSVAERVGFPIRVRPVGAPSGQGQSLMVRAEDIEPAWQYAVSAADAPAPTRVLAETVVEVDHEVTLLAVRSNGPAGPVLEFCAPIGHRHIEGPNGQLVLESWQPQGMSDVALDAAKSIAGRVVRSLGGRGLFAVELLICGDEVYFAGVSARPADIVLLTLRTQRLSGFELQARAILGLPIDTIMISPGAAWLTYSSAADGAAVQPQPDVVPVLPEVLTVAETDVQVFRDDANNPRRRLGVAVATAAEVRVARDRAGQASAALGKAWL